MAQYRTGTATFTNGSQTVTGTGVDWTDVQAGYTIHRTNDNVLYTIASRDSSTQLTLTGNYVGTTGSSTYEISTDYTPNFEFHEINKGDKSWPIHLTETVRALDTELQNVLDAQTAFELDMQDQFDDFTVGVAEGICTTEAAFNQIVESRRKSFAGSGFVRFGLESSYCNLDPGLSTFDNPTTITSNYASKVYLGGLGVAGNLNNCPLVNINGRLIYISGVNTSVDTLGNRMQLPSASNDYTLPARLDLIGLEIWDEYISTLDFAYPLGNTQYENSTFTCADSTVISVANGSFTGYGTYSLFGNHQSSGDVIGHGFVWSTASDAVKASFCADARNNVYLKDGQYVQTRYRIRTIEGTANVYGGLFLTGTLYFDTNNYIIPKGQRVSITADTSTATTATSSDGYVYKAYNSTSMTYGSIDKGCWKANGDASDELDEYSGVNGHCYFLPIAAIARKNKGAYHPYYNKNGTAMCLNVDNTTEALWYATDRTYSSTQDCFTYKSGGNIGASSGHPKGVFYDQITSDDVLDMRKSAHKLSPTQVNAIECDRLMNGKFRGWEYPWKTLFNNATITTSAAATYSSANDKGTISVATSASTNPRDTSTAIFSGYDSLFWHVGSSSLAMSIRVLNYSSNDRIYWVYGSDNKAYFYSSGDISTEFNANFSTGAVLYPGCTYLDTTDLPSHEVVHVDMIGSIPTLYSLFPNGLPSGGFIGTPDGAIDDFTLTRRAESLLYAVRSTDSGATWSLITSPTFTEANNKITLTDEPASNVVLIFYSTRSNAFNPGDRDIPLAGSINQVISTCASSKVLGGDLIPWTTKLTARSSNKRYGFTKLDQYSITTNGNIDGSTGGRRPKHQTIHWLSDITSDVPAVKIMPYQVDYTGFYRTLVGFREMIYDSGWGDDDCFYIVDEIDDIIDDNGNYGLYGTLETSAHLCRYFTWGE